MRTLIAGLRLALFPSAVMAVCAVAGAPWWAAAGFSLVALAQVAILENAR